MLQPVSALSRVRRVLKESLFFGNEPTPELIGILLVYLIQGILGLARLAVSFFLKDDLGLEPATMAALTGLAALPWMVKPLFGFLSDGLPLFGYRRRSYLVLAGLLGSLSWLALATIVHSAAWATLAIALISLSAAMSDVVADSLIVERARRESVGKAGSLQALAWGTTALGSLLTAYFSGLLLEYLDVRTIFAVTAIFPLGGVAIAGLIQDTPITQQPNWGSVSKQVQQVYQALLRPTILLPTAFIFIWQSTPNTESAFFYFLTNELGFEPEFLGRVRLVTSAATLIGVWIFQRFLRSVPFRVIFAWTIVLSTVLGMTMLVLVTHANRALGIDDQWFSLGDSLILTMMGEIAYMPILVLAARVCPPGIEATLFALLMSIFNLSGVLANEIGALLTHWLGITETNFTNLWLLVLITNLSNLIPLPFLGWLPQGDPNGEESVVHMHSPPTPSKSSKPLVKC